MKTMSDKETELEAEVERLTARIRELENVENEIQIAVVSAGDEDSQVENQMQAKLRAKPQIFSGTETTFDDWLKHFQLCGSINGWTNEQSRQQLAVHLRGQAQRVYNVLSSEDSQSYEKLISALKSSLEPPQQRAIHKLAFRGRRRMKNKSLVNLATDLRHLATRAFPGKETAMIDEELLEQFISALDTRELRLGVSQTSPKSFDEALHTALKLETLFTLEQVKTKQDVNIVHEQTQPSLTTAEINLTGAQDSNPPQWAKEIIEQQNKIERLLENGQRQPKRKVEEATNVIIVENRVISEQIARHGSYRTGVTRETVTGWVHTGDELARAFITTIKRTTSSEDCQRDNEQCHICQM